MKTAPNQASPQRLSELLLYHAALGRGYETTIPVAECLVFTSALSPQAIRTFNLAEARFRTWHVSTKEEMRKELEAMKEQPKQMASVTGATKQRMKGMEEQLAKLPYAALTDDGACKPTLIEMLKKSAYGCMTYVDPLGVRLVKGLSHPVHLTAELSLRSLTGRNGADSTLIRANATGGALMHSLAGADVRFDYISQCHPSELQKLIERIRTTSAGRVARDGAVMITGAQDRVELAASVDELEKLLMRVYVLGASEETKRAKVKFAPAAAKEWEEFLGWGLSELLRLDKPPTAWMLQLADESPASPRLSILAATKAAIAAAFIDTLRMGGNLKEVELGAHHLLEAKANARHIYVESSKHDSHAKKVGNLRPELSGRAAYITEHKLKAAKDALIDAINESPDRRIPRRAMRDIPGCTFGLLDELVTRGDLTEIREASRNSGSAEAARRYYALPCDSPVVDSGEAVDEFMEGCEAFTTNPDYVDTGRCMFLYLQIQEKAQEFDRKFYLPALPLSRMSKEQRLALPKILDMFRSDLRLRGVVEGYDGEPEPEHLLDDESPLDVDGLNLWVRFKSGTITQMCDWRKLAKLGFAESWGHGDRHEGKEEAPEVPEE